MTDRRIVLVAGSGRSGTSTLAGILKELGLRVPGPEVEADESNPRGFAEPRWVVDFHDRLLRRAVVQVSDARPSAWQDAARLGCRPGPRQELSAWLAGHVDTGPLVVKDPRLTWFHELWRETSLELGVTPVFATMLRPPAEVVASKQAHYNAGMPVTFGLAAWLNLMLGTERQTRGQARVFLRYSDLVSDWRSAVAPLGAHLDLAAVPGAGARVDAFVDPSLHRQQPGWEHLGPSGELTGIARDAWLLLDALADGDDPGLHPALDEVRARYASCYDMAEATARSSVVAARLRAERGARGEPVAVPRPLLSRVRARLSGSA